MWLVVLNLYILEETKQPVLPEKFCAVSIKTVKIYPIFFIETLSLLSGVRYTLRAILIPIIYSQHSYHV